MIARVYRRSAKWYMDYTDYCGRRVRKVITEARTKAQAQSALFRSIDREARIRDGYQASVDNSAVVASLVEGFLLHKALTCSYATVQYYRAALGGTVGKFTRPDGSSWPPASCTPVADVRAMRRMWHQGPLAVERVEQVSPEVLEQYIETHQSMAVRSLNKSVASLKTMLNWAERGGRIASNPIKGMSRIGKPAKRNRYLRREEAEQLLRASPEPLRTIWLTFLTTGMRKGELIALCWPQVDFAAMSIRVLASTTKSRRQRDVVMTPELASSLNCLKVEARDPTSYVFPTRNGTPNRNNLPRAFKRCLRHAGIGAWDVSLHTLRHTFASTLILAGANVKVVSELLGHASIQMTLDTYTHVFPADKREAMKLMPFGRPDAWHTDGTRQRAMPQAAVG